LFVGSVAGPHSPAVPRTMIQRWGRVLCVVACAASCMFALSFLPVSWSLHQLSITAPRLPTPASGKWGTRLSACLLDSRHAAPVPGRRQFPASSLFAFATTVSSSALLIIPLLILALLLGTGLVLLWNPGLRRTLRVIRMLVPMFMEYQLLAWRTRNETEKVQRMAFDAFHEAWAQAPLQLCLDLRGFYVKIGQIMAGSFPDALPKPYEKALALLLEEVPPQPFDIIRHVVEEEYDCPLHAVFAEFDEVPLGSASVGQAHRARLIDGSQVVVKVQYPDVEKNFRMDFSTIIRIFEAVNPEMVGPLRKQEDIFNSEFDYRLEAAHLRRMCDDVQPFCTTRGLNVGFPTPWDDVHPKRSFTPNGKSLITRRVLVTDLCPGRSVEKIGDEVVAQIARMRGTTAAALNEECSRSIADPKFAETLLSFAGPNEWQVEAIRGFQNCCSAALGWKAQASLPNGPQLMRRIYDVYGYMLFERRCFNPDAHAGNVLLDEQTSRISLIDYGQVLDISETECLALAYLIVGLNAHHEALVREAYVLCGNDITWKGPGGKLGMRPPPDWCCMAIAEMHFGGMPGLASGMKAFGFASIAEAMGPKMAEVVEIHRTPPAYMFFQRAVQCLNGVANKVGALGIPPAKLLFPTALKFVQERGLPTEDLNAACLYLAQFKWDASV